MKAKNKEIVICVTGGISAYKACEVVRYLKKKGFAVTVLMTKEAVNFVGPLTFMTLSQRQVVTDMFSDDINWNPAHISIADRADLVVVVPATANCIGKLAQGICDDIIGCVVMATKAKVMICPAMNENMYNHPAMQKNLAVLKDFGYKIIGPIKGELACAKEGVGHLAEVSDITSEIEKFFK